VSGHALTDVLERVLDKGIVITGDIKINLINTELLTIQIRLLIASVDKAKEMGIDWWSRASYPQQLLIDEQRKQIETLQKRLDSFESMQKEEFSAIRKELEATRTKKRKGWLKK
jgi:hypothetical protein